MSIETLTIGGTDVEVHRKKIKNLHIGVYPPNGYVRVAAPEVLSIDAIRIAVLTRMGWIRRKQAQFLAQDRQAPRQLVSGETHFLFGRPLRLDVTPWKKKVHSIAKQGADRLSFLVPEGSTVEDRRRWMRNWHRTQLRRVAAPRIADWSEVLGVAPTSWGLRKMKTKWGSCNPGSRIIWLNEELSQKPVEAIDYVILHELAHLISSRHDESFVAVLDAHLPRWRQIRSELNALPLSAW
ncbi:M48 family metallopeptidase [Rubellimicrobium roseum]|uniref:M48 family metallopeptidase n=1 Tax=Rubellimicrobium roseum TaxID=687525 RepID=A0A5C4NGE8_9RHOB|nr:SprT family zinc-dependent metalloprotease [Rubellimicrobium roseum]TNC72468.1 M48 family metallopeptidase [Rubellimicrobium roseum]